LTIDLNVSPYNTGSGWLPIGDNSGTTSTRFYGHFDGGGYQVQNLFISRSETSQVGLFGTIHSAAISNLSLTNVSVTGNQFVGALIGIDYGAGSVNTVDSSGTVTGSTYIGGLIGYRYSTTIQSAHTSGSV